MASFVREVLSASGRLSEKEDYSGKATRLRNGIDDLKAGLRKKIEARYTDFSASSFEVSKQISYLDEVIKEIESLEVSIQKNVKPGLTDASLETNELLRQMRELSDSAKAANHIRQVYDTMESANNSIDQKQFAVATKKLKIIEDAILAPMSPGQDSEVIAAYESIKIEFQTSQEKLRYVLNQEWNQQVRIETVIDTNETVRSLTFGTKDTSSTFWSMIRAMNHTETLAFRLNKFGSKFLSEIVQPLFDSTVMSVECEKSLYNTLIIKSVPSRPESKQVLSAMEQIFSILGEFLCFSVEEGNSGKTLIELLGESYSHRVKDLVIKECLVPAVPNERQGLEEYHSVIRAAESLQDEFVKIKFCAANDSTILAYARNVDTTFANKRCQSILAYGRSLMKEDLHNSKLAEEDENSSQVNFPVKGNNTFMDPSFLAINNFEDELLPLPKGMSLDKSIFAFPKCQVCTLVFKLMDLVKKTLNEACSETTTAFLAERLLVTSRNLVEMFCDVVPVYHADSLAKFPQLSALVYNSCYYIAHKCLTLGIECSTTNDSPLKNRVVTFADLIIRLRQTGVDVFLQQMRRQRDEMRSILKDSSSGLGQLTGNDPLPPSAEKCIRQILHQFMHIQTLWQNVLPSNIYCKSMGTLINTTIEDAIQKVVVLDDIAADAASQLSAMFTTLEEQAPNLFVIDGDKESNRGDIIRFVKRWNKFKELILVLNASLREIDDRWAGGKGPLATEFSPEEVKRLIRALFQNSDRRAAVLARIKFE